MLPQNHFAVAAVVTLVAVVLFYPDLDLVDTLVWIVVAGVVAAIIDLDVIILVRLKAKEDPELEQWANPMEATKDFPEFLATLYRKGLFRIIQWTHLGIAIVATMIGYLWLPDYFIPIFIGAWSHIVSDVPYVSRISRMAYAGA
ncbi:MAG: hypothetical protein JSW25_07420 [Thermoplasmata archaeon]|nr:MAG: hypothetical protein JSW25_07420 [Thermoplasmata archaeon]